MPLWKFADDIDLLTGTNNELQELTNLLANSATRYCMEISTEKSKVMMNSNDTCKHHSLWEQTRGSE